MQPSILVGCILLASGSNGAGKSSLEVTGLLIWGAPPPKTKLSTAEPMTLGLILPLLATSIYRVIRNRQRAESSLNFKLPHPAAFGINRAWGTSDAAADYRTHQAGFDTFIILLTYAKVGRMSSCSSAPLSKEILAELLKLNQYDDDPRARRTCRSFKAQAEQLERNLQSLETQLHQRGDHPSTSRLRNSPEPAPQEQVI